MDALTSASLLLRIRNPSDSGAWQEFVGVYSPMVRDYCLQRKLQPSDADDIVQDVMVAISRAIGQFNYDPTKGKFRSWLGTIAANRIRNHQTRQAKRYAQSINNFSSPDSDAIQLPKPELCADPDSAWVEIFSRRVFATACERIQPDVAPNQWACFEATWIRNESAAEVAQSLQIPIQQVYLNKSRVLKRLETEVLILADEIPFPGRADDDGANST